jgi:hypothetical protein
MLVKISMEHWWNETDRGTPSEDQDYLDDLYRPSAYRAVNTLRFGYKNQSVNVV